MQISLTVSIARKSDYEVAVSGPDGSDNYTITYVGGTLTVRDNAYDSGRVTAAPGCNAGGEMTYTCSHDSYLALIGLIGFSLFWFVIKKKSERHRKVVKE
ncbi:MAG: hypothetical protein IJY65_04260 [Clostridia bacterium]|nr:hypothetical protein [Clostridia bacterium]